MLREPQRELERHPAVQRVTGSPDDRYRELRASLDTAVLGVDTDRATLRVTLWPAPDEPYEYEPVSFQAGTPPRILWTVLDRLTDRVS